MKRVEGKVALVTGAARGIGAALCVLLAFDVAPARAQASASRPPRRPSLGAGADSNDAEAYSRQGGDQLARNPERAAASFYWAGRLNPEAAIHPYALSVALLLSNPGQLRGYLLGDRRVLRQPEIRRIDTLMQRALILDPFLHRWLDDEFIMQFVMGELNVSLRLGGYDASASDLRFALRDWMQGSESELRPMLDEAESRFGEAAAGWNDVARRHPRSAGPRADRARAFYLAGQFDSARAELMSALRIARARDADSVRFFYESKAAWEYGLGRIFEHLGRLDSARAAYERALNEDLSYYPAHVRLGLLHYARGDTAAALSEFASAVGVKGDEYLPRIRYAAALRVAGRYDSAAVQLHQAIALEPWAPMPRLMLGLVLQAQRDNDGALAAFEDYLARAPRFDPNRLAVTELTGSLRAARK